MSFSPPLAQTTRIAYSSGHPLVIPFTASMQRRDSWPHQPNDILPKLQLWWNGTHVEWTHRDFTVIAPPPGTPPQRLQEIQFELPITLYPWLLPSDRQRISFTYRICHSSGEVEWLGEYGQNGLIELVDIGQQGLVDPLERPWSAGQGDQCHWRWLADESVPFSRYLPHTKLYAAWCIGEDGIFRGHEATQPFQLLLLIPRAQPHVRGGNPHIIVRSSVQGLSISSSSGRRDIDTVSAADNSLISIDFIWQTNLAQFFTQCLSLGLNIQITDGPSSVVVLSRLTPWAFPLHSLVLPLSGADDAVTRIPSNSVSFLDHPVALWRFEFKAQDSESAAFRELCVNSRDEYLEVHREGSLFAVSPAFRHGRSCVFAMQTPHSLPMEHLPTPPPSPPSHSSRAPAPTSSSVIESETIDAKTQLPQMATSETKQRPGVIIWLLMLIVQLHLLPLRFLFVRLRSSQAASALARPLEEETCSEGSSHPVDEEGYSQEAEQSYPELAPSLTTKVSLDVPGGLVRIVMCSADAERQLQVADVSAHVTLLLNSRRIEDTQITALDQRYVVLAAHVGAAQGVLDVVCTI